MLASQCNIYVHAGGCKCACLKQEQELRNTGKLRNLSLPVPRYGMQADKGPHVADRQADMAGAMCKSQRQGSPMSALGLGAPKGSSCLHVRVLKWNTHKSLIGSNLLYPQCNASARYHFRRGRDSAPPQRQNGLWTDAQSHKMASTYISQCLLDRKFGLFAECETHFSFVPPKTYILPFCCQLTCPKRAAGQ